MDKKDFEKPHNEQKESHVPIFEKEADLPSEVKSAMAEIFSQNEIDQLLKTINGDVPDDIDLCPSKATRKIKMYDFKRPDRFCREEHDSLQCLHEKLAHKWSVYISRYFQKEIEINFACVDQLTYDEFNRSISNPTTMLAVPGRFSFSIPQPSPPLIIIEIDPVITIEFLNNLFCGTTTEGQLFRELTSIEKSALRHFCKPLLDTYSQIWDDNYGEKLELGDMRIESNPYFNRDAFPGEMVVLVTYHIQFGNAKGMINICLPYPILHPMNPFMLPKYHYNNFYLQQTEKTLPKTLLKNLPVVLQVEYFRQIILYKDLKSLRPGNILYAPRCYQDGLCSLMVGSKVLFRGEVIADCTNRLNPYCKKIIKIVEKINPHKEFDSMANRDCMEMEKTLANMKVLLAVEIGRTVTTVKELSKMRKGTIVELDSLAGWPVTVFANNTLVARGEVVVIDENFGVRITHLAEAPDDPPEGAADEGGAEAVVSSAEEPSRGDDDNAAV
ncbi:FliM/FliN family flagellar motor switch protein [Treponema primitia]|uniref:FliM/FliN family flagellar motor switch protein n=1 Tax=Treponema primitia TaxID=88058 RepID=UPI0039813625